MKMLSRRMILSIMQVIGMIMAEMRCRIMMRIITKPPRFNIMRSRHC